METILIDPQDPLPSPLAVLFPERRSKRRSSSNQSGDERTKFAAAVRQTDRNRLPLQAFTNADPIPPPKSVSLARVAEDGKKQPLVSPSLKDDAGSILGNLGPLTKHRPTSSSRPTPSPLAVVVAPGKVADGEGRREGEEVTVVEAEVDEGSEGGSFYSAKSTISFTAPIPVPEPLDLSAPSSSAVSTPPSLPALSHNSSSSSAESSSIATPPSVPVDAALPLGATALDSPLAHKIKLASAAGTETEAKEVDPLQVREESLSPYPSPPLPPRHSALFHPSASTSALPFPSSASPSSRSTTSLTSTSASAPSARTSSSSFSRSPSVVPLAEAAPSLPSSVKVVTLPEDAFRKWGLLPQKGGSGGAGGSSKPPSSSKTRGWANLGKGSAKGMGKGRRLSDDGAGGDAAGSERRSRRVKSASPMV